MKLSDEQADKYIEEIISHIRHSLITKAKEYVRNSDRMHNFNTGARMTGMHREKIMEAFRLKHEISRKDLVNDLSEHILPSKEYAIEKYGDIINYNILELMSILQRIDYDEQD